MINYQPPNIVGCATVEDAHDLPSILWTHLTVHCRFGGASLLFGFGITNANLDPTIFGKLYVMSV